MDVVMKRLAVALRLFLCAAAVGVMLPLSAARAGVYQICVDYQVSYSDATIVVGDDFITDNSDRAATGVRIQVINKATGVVAVDTYTSDGLYPGCADVVVSGTDDYKVRVLSEAEVNGNTIAVWNDDTHNQFYAHVRTTWRPGVVGDITIRTPVADQWNIMAVSSWAMTRSNAGLSGKNLRFYTQECPMASHYNCIALSAPEAGRVYICPSASTTCTKGAGQKYVIAHEMGHQIAYQSNGHGFSSVDSSYIGGICGVDGHSFTTMEYQSLAAAEGIAHYWAAYAFNSESESDCYFHRFSTTFWNHVSGGHAQNFSCEGAPDPAGAPGVDGSDYQGDVCGGGGGLGCEYDWLRIWWDLTTDEGLTPSDVYSIWDLADPDTWDSGGSNVADRMYSAAWSVSSAVGASYNRWDNYNGVVR